MENFSRVNRFRRFRIVDKHFKITAKCRRFARGQMKGKVLKILARMCVLCNLHMK